MVLTRSANLRRSAAVREPRLFYLKEAVAPLLTDVMPKVSRNGQSAILSTEELDELFDAMSPRCRAALSICRYTAARISEALALKWKNISAGFVVLEKSNTKTKCTRQVPLHPALALELQRWGEGQRPCDTRADAWIFPRRGGQEPTPRRTIDDALRRACERKGVQGVSTHTMRRSALTSASNGGVPLRHIQSLSGHTSLDCLARYLSVSDAQKRTATMAFA